ncbi:MAG: Lin1244/Lin1753 domain-containing protein [Saccharofermentanales bacterium]|jgi:hypothetical protein
MGFSWIKHDLKIKGDPELQTIIRRYGIAGYGVYWALLEYMAIQDKGIVEVKHYTYDMLADFFCVEKDTFRAIIDEFLNYGLISSNDERTVLWSDSVLADLEVYERNASKSRKGAEARWHKEKQEETDRADDAHAPSICSEDIPEGYAITSQVSHTSDTSNHKDHKDERTSQDITHETFEAYFDDYSMHFFNKPYNELDKGNKLPIELLVDKYGIVDVGSMMYETMNADQSAGDEEYRVCNPIAFLTALLKEINDEENQHPIIDDPPENVEALIEDFDRDDKESYARLLMKYDEKMIRLALQFAATRAETNLLGYTRRVLEDWRMRGITTPEKYRKEYQS